MFEPAPCNIIVFQDWHIRVWPVDGCKNLLVFFPPKHAEHIAQVRHWGEARFSWNSLLRWPRHVAHACQLTPPKQEKHGIFVQVVGWPDSAEQHHAKVKLKNIWSPDSACSGQDKPTAKRVLDTICSGLQRPCLAFTSLPYRSIARCSCVWIYEFLDSGLLLLFETC